MIADLLADWHWRRFDSACATPKAAQIDRLRAVLRSGADSRAGRLHRFARMAAISDPKALLAAWQREVPVRTHAQMQAQLDRVHHGDWQELCGTAPEYFAMTAGSTGRYKYIPVTRDYRREIGRVSMAFRGAMLNACPALRGRASAFLVGSAEGGRSPAGVPQGFASGFNYRRLPRAIRAGFPLPYWVFTIIDRHERDYAIGRMLVGNDRLGVLGAITPLNLLNVLDALERDRERLLRDVAEGTLTIGSPMAVRGSHRTRPNPALAKALATAWPGTAAPTTLLFPALQAMVCWQGGSFGCYLAELRQRFQGSTVFEFPLSASEGVFAIPHRANQAGGVAAVTSHFLEFVPADAPGAAPCPVWELSDGASYRVVVSQSGGLYRYDTDDLVRVAGRHRATPVLEFVSKASRCVSIANERITEADVATAMTESLRILGRRCPAFLFVPCRDRRYRVLVECREADGWDLAGLAAVLDRQLRLAAMGYDFEREDELLRPLEVIGVRNGSLARPSQDALPNAQHKPQLLTTTFDLHRTPGVEAIDAH